MAKQTAYTLAYDLLIENIRDYARGLATMMEVQDVIATFESEVIKSYQDKIAQRNFM